MFNVPFRYGSAWDRNADDKTEPVMVIGEELNNQWFGGEDSVGRLLSINGRDFRIVGVLSHWRPAIKFYDLTGSPLLLPEALFIPMSFIRPMEIRPYGFQYNWKAYTSTGQGTDNESFLAGETIFLQMWVELQSPGEVAAYRSFLDTYAMEQRRIGRFQRPLDNRVTPLLEYMKERGCVPPEATAMMIAANLFLAACALSLMGLLMARFLARAPEIGMRRALGARRWDIFVQHVIECEVMGLAGGVLGLVLASAGLSLVSWWYKAMTPSNRDDVFRMDLSMAWFAAVVSLAAGLLAGFYPAHHVCRIAPASHLKIQ